MIGLDLNGSKLLIPKFGISLEMFERENGESEGSDRRGSKEVKVLAAAEVMVVPWTAICQMQDPEGGERQIVFVRAQGVARPAAGRW